MRLSTRASLAGGFTPLVFDTYTDTAGVLLDAHTPELGGPITKLTAAGTGISIISTNGRARPSVNSQVGGYYYAAAVGNDQTVEADVHVYTTVASEASAICARMSTSVHTYYFLGYSATTTSWRLAKVVAGTTTALATFGSAPSNATDHRLKLACIGTTISGWVDGSLVGAITDSAIASGKAGIRNSAGSLSETGGHHYDNLIAY